MNEVILLKFGEIVLKGLNRSSFETILIKNIKRRLAGLGGIELWKAQSTVYVRLLDENADIAEAVERLSTVFGIAALCRAGVAKKDIEEIKRCSVEYFEEKLASTRTFKVEAKRADKTFPLISPEICAQVGECLLDAYPNLRVDVVHPDVVVAVEVRETAAYIHANRLPGAGGIPVGSSGSAALLISGGIDSPVAGYMMSKRGLSLTAIHFVSPPYTGERARLKVETLLEKIAAYCGRINFVVVPFTEIQEKIRSDCPEDLFTIIMRRFMMRIAEKIALDQGCGALITGESLGQVASQTIAGIACTDSVCTLPVFRPLIGMDKEEIVTVSRRIDTFETSILPYEDCCTVFTPRHPRTRPRMESVERAEMQANTDWDELIERAVAGVQCKNVDA
ncbi:MAG: tRNA uracil 4-sulfurtransferase ThiI [Acetanaerobacterium sp.]